MFAEHHSVSREEVSTHTTKTASLTHVRGHNELCGLLTGGLIGLVQELSFPGQQFVQACRGKVGDPGQDLGETGLGLDVAEATGPDHRQHSGGTIGPTLAMKVQLGSQGGASQCALSAIV